mgnify:CR=1 FL=1
MIHIIADSTSAIPQEMLSKYSNLHVIPLSLSIKGEYIPENEFFDMPTLFNILIEKEKTLEYLEKKELLKTEMLKTARDLSRDLGYYKEELK